MGFLGRTLLIWLIVLAVPAQGAAAATMAYCGPNHHGGGGAAVQALETESAEHSNHRSGTHNAHAHHDMAAQADEGNSAAADSAASPQGGHAVEQKCSACASCCSISVILSSPIAVPVPAVTPTVFSAVVLSVAAFATDGPDRPPRIALA